MPGGSLNEERDSERYSRTPRSGMDADDSRARPDRDFLLHLRCHEATGTGSVRFDGADPSSVAHPVSPLQCRLRVAGRVRLRHWLGARFAHPSLRASARGRHGRRDRDQSDPKHPVERRTRLAR